MVHPGSIDYLHFARLGKLQVKAANDLDLEVGCVIASIDYQASYVNMFKAVGYLNDPEVIFLATNVLFLVLCQGFSFVKERDRRYLHSPSKCLAWVKKC